MYAKRRAVAPTMEDIQVNIPGPLLLFLVVCIEILTLITVVYLPPVDWFDRLSASPLIGEEPASMLRCAGNEFYFGKESLEYARALKDLARVKKRSAEAMPLLAQALEIQTAYQEGAHPLQRYLGSMEVVDTLLVLAKLMMQDGRTASTEQLLSRAYSLAFTSKLPSLAPVAQQYARVLEMSKLTQRANAVREANTGNHERRRYDGFVRSLSGIPAENRRGMALFYFGSYLSATAKELLLSERLPEAELYAQQCVEALAQVSDYPHRSTDLAQLALIYSEEKKYLQSAKTYEHCIDLLHSVCEPDVLSLLPVYQSTAEVLGLLKQQGEAKAMRERSREIFMFLFELRDRYKAPENAEKFSPAQGTLVLAMYDNRRYSGRIMKVFGKQMYQVHLIGSPIKNSDPVVGYRSLEPHPSYNAYCAGIRPALPCPSSRQQI